MSLVLISHGDLAKGLLHSAQMIVGEIPRSYALGLYESESIEDFCKKFEQALDALADDKPLVLCDMSGGTPCNGALRYLDRIRGLYSGMNLPMVIGVATSSTEVLKDAKEQIYDVGLKLAKITGSNQ